MSRRTSLLLAPSLLLAGCVIDLDDGDDPPPDPGSDLVEYQLVPRGNLATLDTVIAVGDDPGSFWMMHRDDDGGYWTPDPLEYYLLDRATGARSSSIVLTEHWEHTTGAAWADGRLWVHYDANDSGVVASIDPVTGVETERYRVGVGFGAMSVRDGALYLGQRDVSAEVQVRDLATGELTDRLWAEGFQASLRGLATVQPHNAAAPELWGSSMAGNVLTILVDRVPRARAVVPGFGANELGALMFAGQQLFVVADEQLFFYDVVRPQ